MGPVRWEDQVSLLSEGGGWGAVDEAQLGSGPCSASHGYRAADPEARAPVGEARGESRARSPDLPSTASVLPLPPAWTALAHRTAEKNPFPPPRVSAPAFFPHRPAHSDVRAAGLGGPGPEAGGREAGGSGPPRHLEPPGLTGNGALGGALESRVNQPPEFPSRRGRGKGGDAPGGRPPRRPVTGPGAGVGRSGGGGPGASGGAGVRATL